MRTNSLLPTLQNKRAIEALHAEVDRIEDMYNTSSSDSAIPSWLAKAPDDLARYFTFFLFLIDTFIYTLFFFVFIDLLLNNNMPKQSLLS